MSNESKDLVSLLEGEYARAFGIMLKEKEYNES